jgi:putative phage-type endonuclease
MNAPAAVPAIVGELDRQKYIGGSDVAAILGISPWRTALQVWQEKTTPRAGDDDKPIFTRGKRMEPYVIDLLAEECGLVIVARGNRYRDPEHPFLCAEIDAETDDATNIEIKTVNPFNAKEWGEEKSDEIPIHYAAQAMHGLMVTGRAVCIFGVLIGSDDFRTYRIDRDDETIAGIRAKEIEFWQSIQTDNPPAPVNADDVLRMFARDNGEIISAQAEIAAAVERLAAVKEAIKTAKAEQEAIEDQIKIFMGAASTLAYGGKTLATWKTQTAKRLDIKAVQTECPDIAAKFTKEIASRVFRIK